MTSHDNVTDSKYHSGAIEVGQIYFDHHSDTNGTFECGKRIVQAADKAIRQAMEAQQSDLATLRKQLENAREALREYLEAEEIDDPVIRMQELSVCREQARKALSAIKGDKS